MILTEISPFEKRKTAKDLSEILLRKISSLTSEINYEFIRDGVLEPLVSHQMYISREQDIYYIDPKVDEGLRIKGKIKAFREKLEDKQYLFSEIASSLSLPYLPLKDIKEGRRFKFRWQNSLRECIVVLSYPRQVNRNEIRRMIESLENNFDGYLIILSPFEGQGKWLYSLKETFSSPFLSSIIFWLPRTFSDDESIFVEEYIAKNHIVQEFPEIAIGIKKDEVNFKEILTNLYFEGKIVYGTGNILENLRDIGYLPIEKLASHLYEESLTKLHPNHYKIMPRIDYSTTMQIKSLYRNFIRHGKITIEDSEKKGLSPYIKGILEPMGIVKRKGGHLFISLDAENELVSHLLNLTSGEKDLETIKKALKKGVWSIGNDQANLLLSAFIISGYLVAYRKEEIVELDDLVQFSIGGITSLKAGKVLQPELISYIACGSFIWGDVEEIPTPLTQKMMWKETLLLAKRIRNMLKFINQSIIKYKDYTIFRKMTIDHSVINRLNLFFSSFKLSLSPGDGLHTVLGYLKENPALNEDVAYLERINIFFKDRFLILNKHFIYLTDTLIKLPKELQAEADTLLAEIEGYLNAEEDIYESIKEKWEYFFEAFSGYYRKRHDLYYHSPLFDIRRDIEEAEEAKTLVKISYISSQITFDKDWLEIKRDLEGLPKRCTADINYELYMKPVCGCGFNADDKPPELSVDFMKICRDGLYNFIKVIQMADSKEKLDSYILNLRDTGKNNIADKIHSLLNLNLKKTNIRLILNLLVEDVIKEIDNALKGKWKIKPVNISDFFEKIKGRRIKYAELKGLFFQWVGTDNDSVIWIKADEANIADILSEELGKYGVNGERVLQNLNVNLHSKPFNKRGLISLPEKEEFEMLEEELKKEGLIENLGDIDLSGFAKERLFELLNSERMKYLKKRLRTEIFYRLWEKATENDIKNTEDEMMTDIIEIMLLLNDEAGYKGLDIFTKIIAPSNYLIEKIIYENAKEEKIEENTIQRIEDRFSKIVKRYQNSNYADTGVKDIEYLRDKLRGIVLILDGLRYDLWVVFKKILRDEGYNIKEEGFIIKPPTTTENFRKKLGIKTEGENTGYINSKGYSLIKYAEKRSGIRKINRFLQGTEDIKFLHFNFIDTKTHGSTIELYPLYMTIKNDFILTLLPVIKKNVPLYIISDHGFSDKKRLKERYTHGGGTIWETILPIAEIR